MFGGAAVVAFADATSDALAYGFVAVLFVLTSLVLMISPADRRIK